MKTLFTCIAALFIIVACSNDDDNNSVNPDIVGTWGLSEVLADPGDGSGTFMPVDSTREITFNANGTYTSNSENFCSFVVNTDNIIEPSTGTYSATEIHCGNENPTNLLYTIDANDNLIITYPCIEPCQAKYVRIN